MSNLTVRAVQTYQPAYQPVRMVPVQFRPLPDLFHQMPVDTVRVQPRPVAPVPTAAVMFTPGPVCSPVPVCAPGNSGYKLPTNLIKNSRPETYRDKLNGSLQRVGESQVEILTGGGKIVVGAAKTAVYAPFGAIEAVGRTAVALTGGQVTYPQSSPLNQMGEGIELMGEGTGQVIVGSGKQAVAVTESLIYAPLATLEVGARGAGLVAGGAVRAGSWVGKQVSESFIGREFATGYRDAMPSRN